MKRPLMYGITVLLLGFITIAWAATPTITLSWEANTEEDLAGYNIYRAESSADLTIDAAHKITMVPASTHEYIDQVPSENKMYYYALTAYDTSLNESVPSYAEAMSKDYPPASPLGFSAVAE